MKKAIQSIITLIVIIIVANNFLFAQKTQSRDIKITGDFVNLPKTDTGRRVLLGYSTEDWFSKSVFHTITCRADSNGNFQFSLPDVGKPYMINLFLRVVTGGEKYFGHDYYYTEPGDDIHIKITLMPHGQNKNDFTGPGSAKYTIAQEINDAYWHDYYDDLANLNISSIKDSTELNIKMEALAGIIRKYEEKKIKAINAENVSSTIKVLLNHEFARYYPDWTWRTELLLRNHQELKTQIAKNYFKHSEEFYDQPDSLSVMCPMSLSEINSRIKMNLMTRNNSNNVDMGTMYNAIKINFSGYLRDRLMAEFIFNRFLIPYYAPLSTDLRDSIYQDALVTIQRPNIKKSVEKYIADLAKVTGEKTIIDAEFMDTKGKKLQLSGLKGKVILIDAWFNGCVGCSVFHKDFEKEIYPLFKNNNRFVVLSINVDSDRKRWFSALKTDIYTSPEYINVTTGDWFNGPFMKYYGVTGAPFTLLVDEKGVIRYQPKIYTIKGWIKEISNVLN